MQIKIKNYLGKKTILSLGLALSMFSGLSTSAFAAPVATATVNKGVNFRADQSTSAPVWGFIKQGTVLPVEAANDYWVLVDYNGKQGYVSRSYVTVNENKPAPVPAPAPAPSNPAPAPAPSNPAAGGSLANKIVNTSCLISRPSHLCIRFEGSSAFAFRLFFLHAICISTKWR